MKLITSRENKPLTKTLTHWWISSKELRL